MLVQNMRLISVSSKYLVAKSRQNGCEWYNEAQFVWVVVGVMRMQFNENF